MHKSKDGSTVFDISNECANFIRQITHEFVDIVETDFVKAITFRFSEWHLLCGNKQKEELFSDIKFNIRASKFIGRVAMEPVSAHTDAPWVLSYATPVFLEEHLTTIVCLAFAHIYGPAYVAFLTQDGKQRYRLWKDKWKCGAMNKKMLEKQMEVITAELASACGDIFSDVEKRFLNFVIAVNRAEKIHFSNCYKGRIDLL